MRVMDDQRRESAFRALDANADGQVSMAEAGVNTQLLNAFQRLDRDRDGTIDRPEFARVHVNDGSQAAASGSSATRRPPTWIDEPVQASKRRKE
jgi:Ca2+-binding EF-hand superfamily protein